MAALPDVSRDVSGSLRADPESVFCNTLLTQLVYNE